MQRRYFTVLCCVQYIAGVPRGVLDEPYSQLTPLRGVAVQAGPERLESCPSYVDWRAGGYSAELA